MHVDLLIVPAVQVDLSIVFGVQVDLFIVFDIRFNIDFSCNENLKFGCSSISKIYNCDKDYLYGYKDYLYFLIPKKLFGLLIFFSVYETAKILQNLHIVIICPSFTEFSKSTAKNLPSK